MRSDPLAARPRAEDTLDRARNADESVSVVRPEADPPGVGPAAARALRVGILGADFTGLACAHYALRAGLRPVLIQAGATDTGGLPESRFTVEGLGFDRFHIPIERSDTALCGLLADLGVLDRLTWRQTEWGVAEAGRLRTMRGRLDFLGLQLREWGWRSLPASVATRAQPNTSSTRCCQTQRFQSWHHNDRRHPRCPVCGHLEMPITARGILFDLVGHERPVNGYLRGGYRALYDSLLASVLKRGASVARGAQLLSVEADSTGAFVTCEIGTHRFDAVVSTLSLPQLAKLSRGQIVRHLPFPETDAPPDLSAVVITRRAQPLPYQTLLASSEAPFSRAFNASAVIPADLRAGLFPVYFSGACRPPTGDTVHTRELLQQLATQEYLRLCPNADASDIQRVEVFQKSVSDMTWANEHLLTPPPRQVGNTRLLLCTGARPFPRRRSVDTSIMLARETLSALRSAF